MLWTKQRGFMLLLLLFSFFNYLSYCVEVWGNTYITNIKPLLILQKRAQWFTHNVDSREHTDKLLIKSRWMKIKDLVNLQNLSFMFRAKSRVLLENMQKQYLVQRTRIIRKSNFKHQLYKLKHKCISVCAAKLWNSLKNDSEGNVSIVQFKKMCKKKMLDTFKFPG